MGAGIALRFPDQSRRVGYGILSIVTISYLPELRECEV